jgi:membrane-associated phospholipid phosphatase
MHSTLAGQLNKLPELPEPDLFAHYHWPLAANRALAVMTRRLFPTTTPQNLAAIDALESHWISILNQILAGHPTLDVAAVAYAKLGIAVADSFIVCWHNKYIYNVVRPITYIQKVIEPTWNMPDVADPVVTPPFPEYTSGHSVQSSAAAAVLTSMFGDNFAFTDHTDDALGYPPRSFPSFTTAAEEAAISRLYGGIHYRAAIENGLAQGRCVAEKVLALHFHD